MGKANADLGYYVEKHMLYKKDYPNEWAMLDDMCFKSKNLFNHVNYILRTAWFASQHMYKGEPLHEDPVIAEKIKAEVDNINSLIDEYNSKSKRKNPEKHIDESNGSLSAYFLNWLLKHDSDYKEMPYSKCAEECISTLCDNWKTFRTCFYDYLKNKDKYTGCPEAPTYKDKEYGRYMLSVPNQALKLNDGIISFPKSFQGYTITTRRTTDNIRYVKFLPRKDRFIIEVTYADRLVEVSNKKERVLGVDLGVSNLAAVASNVELTPFIINGREIKAFNHYWNKEHARLASVTKKRNGSDYSKRLQQMTESRNNKINDFMHKASKYLIDYAIKNQIDTIIIGHNDGWKTSITSKCSNHRSNQEFNQIPHSRFIQMVEYKGKKNGINVIAVEESYTSGTSSLDDELPVQENYCKQRRRTRGTFTSNDFIDINADVNAAYQIMKKCDVVTPHEKVIYQSVKMVNL